MAMVVFGAAGGLGQALTQRLQEVYPQQQIVAVTRQPLDNRLPGVRYTQLGCYDDETLSRWAEDFKNSGATLEGVVSTIGMLHDDETFPEKQLSELHSSNLEKPFHVNAVIPMLVLKHCQPLFDKKTNAFFVQLSAKVGSIEENYLGGWYSYRASKAALNMLLKTAAIELKRSHKKLVLAAVHPGTTDTKLSKPFQKRVAEDKLYEPQLSAKRIVDVINGLEPSMSGGLFHWDGKKLPY